MKIAFFGTPEFAWNILSWILHPLSPTGSSPWSKGEQIEVVLVVSQPDRQVGRKKELSPTPVKQVALDSKIEILQPEKIRKNNEFHEYLRSLDLDFIVVVAYGKIIPQAILDIPKYGCINIHGSILPKYRGASPVQAAIKAWESETWLTTMYMSAGMDEWDILKVGKVDIDNVDRSPDVFKKFVQIWPKLLIDTLKEIISWDLVWTPQDDSKATYCGKILREDGEVFFTEQSAGEIYNTYRAYTPWPWIYTWYEWKRLVLEEVCLHETPLPNPLLKGEGTDKSTTDVASSLLAGENWERCPWTFIKLSKNRYGIICADQKILDIQRVKLEGKKSMDVVSFVNGNREVVWYEFQ